MRGNEFLGMTACHIENQLSLWRKLILLNFSWTAGKLKPLIEVIYQ